MPPRNGRRDDPRRPVGEGGDAGWRGKPQKSGEDIIAILLVGAEQPLLDGYKISIEETRCRFGSGPFP